VAPAATPASARMSATNDSQSAALDHSDGIPSPGVVSVKERGRAASRPVPSSPMRQTPPVFWRIISLILVAGSSSSQPRHPKHGDERRAVTSQPRIFPALS
jgi:hypothetical protein